MNREIYLLHQTPLELAKDLVHFVPLVAGDQVIEPFRGEGAFFNSFPAFVQKDWAELEQGKDYREISGVYDWVITNPPYCLQENGKKVNSFWFLLDYYSTRARKGIAFLANDICFSTLTPRRMNILKDRGWKINKIVVCSIKKWRGRYFFIILTKTNGFIEFLINNY